MKWGWGILSSHCLSGWWLSICQQFCSRITSPKPMDIYFSFYGCFACLLLTHGKVAQPGWTTASLMTLHGWKLHPTFFHVEETLPTDFGIRRIITESTNFTTCLTVFQISTEGLLGEGRNRWYDKALSMIYLKNGLSTFNCDVSACFGGKISTMPFLEHTIKLLWEATLKVVSNVGRYFWTELPP